MFWGIDILSNYDWCTFSHESRQGLVSLSRDVPLNISTHIIASSLTDDNQETCTALHQNMDERLISGIQQSIAPLSRSSKGRKHLNNSIDSDGGPFNGFANIAPSNPFEPVSQSSSKDVSSLDEVSQTPHSHRRGPACELPVPQTSPFADEEVAWKGRPPYFRQRRALDGENSRKVDATNYTGRLESQRRTANDWYKPGGNEQGRDPERDENTTVGQSDSRGMVPEGAALQENGPNATEDPQSPTSVVEQADTRESSGEEMKEAGETPTPANSVSDVKDGGVVNTKGQTFPRKISFMEKVRGEIKLLVGKLGNDQDKARG
ncbi:hypothetical protein AX15_000738 [Amanita polypyramis BW_CC]|nr:hypothetical protein AX15_000738 [Amanita polypyramis BW_CC]